jgi:hypothetical protein
MALNANFSTFLRAFWGDWATTMSGGASVPFTLIAVFVPNARVKILLALLAICCFGWSSYRVWRTERLARMTVETRLLEAEQAKVVSLPPAPRASLVIYDDANSRFYVDSRQQNPTPTDNIYIELCVTIENKGNRNSVIRRFDIVVQETAQVVKNAQREIRDMVNVRGTSTGAAAARRRSDYLLQTPLTVPAHDAVSGILPFYFLPDNPPIVAAFPQLQFTLTLGDSEGVEVSQDITAEQM